jgi:hypothetical protein
MNKNKENSLENIVGCLVCGHPMNEHEDLSFMKSVDSVCRATAICIEWCRHDYASCRCRICSFCGKKSIFKAVDIHGDNNIDTLICPECKRYETMNGLELFYTRENIK